MPRDAPFPSLYYELMIFRDNLIIFFITLPSMNLTTRLMYNDFVLCLKLFFESDYQSDAPSCNKPGYSIVVH